MIKNTTGLTIEQILAADDRPIDFVECPEWSGRYYLRPMTGTQRGEFERRSQNATHHEDIRNYLVTSAGCTEQGEPLEWTAKQVEALADKNAAVLDRIADKVMEISGLRTEAVKETEGNSESDQSDNSGWIYRLPTGCPCDYCNSGLIQPSLTS